MRGANRIREKSYAKPVRLMCTCCSIAPESGVWGAMEPKTNVATASVQVKYTLTGRQASSLHNVKLELDAAFSDSSPPASLAST